MKLDEGKGGNRRAMAEDKRKFHERFDIDVDIEDEKRRFIVRAFSLLFDDPRLDIGMRSHSVHTLNEATGILGIIFHNKRELHNHIVGKFHECLKLLEGMYNRKVGDHASTSSM